MVAPLASLKPQLGYVVCVREPHRHVGVAVLGEHGQQVLRAERAGVEVVATLDDVGGEAVRRRAGSVSASGVSPKASGEHVVHLAVAVAVLAGAAVAVAVEVGAR